VVARISERTVKAGGGSKKQSKAVAQMTVRTVSKNKKASPASVGMSAKGVKKTLGKGASNKYKAAVRGLNYDTKGSAKRRSAARSASKRTLGYK
jgi:hypothetical protein